MRNHKREHKRDHLILFLRSLATFAAAIDFWFSALRRQIVADSAVEISALLFENSPTNR